MYKDLIIYISQNVSGSLENRPTAIPKLRYKNGEFYSFDAQGAKLLGDGEQFQISNFSVTIELPQSNSRTSLSSVSSLREVEEDDTLNHLKQLSCKALLPIDLQHKSDLFDILQTSSALNQDGSKESDDFLPLNLDHTRPKMEKIDRFDQYFSLPNIVDN